jgi:hypothetical protein
MNENHPKGMDLRQGNRDAHIRRRLARDPKKRSTLMMT